MALLTDTMPADFLILAYGPIRTMRSMKIRKIQNRMKTIIIHGVSA